MKKTRNILIKSLVGILVIIILINAYFMFSNFKILNQLKLDTLNVIEDYFSIPVLELNLTYDPLSLKGFTEVFVGLKDNAIILNNNCTAMIITTNEYQAYSIEQGLKSKVDIRPTTHDIMVSVLKGYNISLLQTKIVENQGMHYFARTIYRHENKILNVDTKASDAIAIAARMNVPIFVKSNLFYSLGKNVC
ncbi:bifunctional nuclease family protein [Candidatus Woesearchaeota archaeon]|nr:bifunctional nuclease family protein [Candidatus Woesearchaeota archaeon]